MDERFMTESSTILMERKGERVDGSKYHFALKAVEFIVGAIWEKSNEKLGYFSFAKPCARISFFRNGDIVYATELHEKFGISKSAISSTLKGLKKKGYVETATNPRMIE